MILRSIILAISLSATGTTQAQGNLSVEKAWARESPPGSPNGAAYFMINNSGAGDQLIGVNVSSDIADRAELHTHKQEGGMMKMERVDAIDIRQGGSAVLKPHADHVMLIGLRRLLKEGETISLELQFKNSEAIMIEVPVLKEAPSKHSH